METNEGFSYIGYQEMIADISTALENTRSVMTELELTKQAEMAKDAALKMKSHIFSVGIMGEFKRGKSTVINAILGEEIAPSDVMPATAVMSRITYGLTPKATVIYKDGHSEEVPVNDIANYVTKITREGAAAAELLNQAIIEYPCQFCQNNVEIIDTPGLNDDDRMDAISEAVIPVLDAVVMVVAANSPFSKSEAEFVRNKLMTSDVTKLIVIVNQIDAIRKVSDRPRVVEGIREKIITEVLDRTEAVHGKDSKQYADTKAKIDDIRLYPISALDALIGRTENDPALVEQSGIKVFEDRLRKLLTQERGTLEITRVSNLLASLLLEGENALNLRLSSLEMSTEQFLANQREAEERIKKLREEKKEEVRRIRNKGKNIQTKMKAIVAEKYNSLERRISDFISSYPIDPEKLRTKGSANEFRNEVRKNMESEISTALSEYSEQINVYLYDELGDERIRIQEYIGDLSGKLTEINSNMQKSSALNTACIIGVDAISNLIAGTCTTIVSAGGLGLMGLGGMVEGYRKAGAKGAVTGLIGGAASSTAVAAALIGAMGVVPFLPFALITGIAGTIGGKIAASIICKEDINNKKIEEIRSSLRETASQTITNLKEQRLLENWAQEQADNQVSELISQMEDEAESMISSMEDTLKSISADIAKANESKEKRIEECHRLESKLKDVRDTLVPIMQKIEAVSKQSA